MRDAAFILAVGVVSACGGAGPTPAAPKAAPHTTGATPAASAAADEPYDDPNESAVAIVMDPLVTKKTPRSAFPKAKVGEGDCWKSVPFVGEHQKDWASLVDKCGKPTGMLEYVKPRDGKLHHIKDKVDSFTVPMLATSCYRVFAVADSSIHDIDIVILKNGAIMGTDDQTQPVAIVQGGSAFCPPDDGTYAFDVKIDGDGQGAYTFGIWTRPK
jgi:hypothetical protein